MILVTLGTQDKSFERLLKQVEKEIKNGNIKDKVIVQAGYTYDKYKSDYMEMFDYVDGNEIVKLVKKSDFVISHAGVGSILTALENKKKIIVVPRLSKYGEHNNDHQVQIAEEFSKEGHVLYLKKMSDLNNVISELDNFTPKLLGHNNLLRETIEEFIDNL